MSFSAFAEGSSDSLPLTLPEATFALVVQDSAQGPDTLQGHMTWKGLRPDAEGTVCFYLPYEDPEFGNFHGLMGRFENISGRQPQAALIGGHLEASTEKQDIQVLPSTETHVLKLKVPPGWKPDTALHMEITAKVPRPKFSDPLDWFYDGFHPQLLPHCQTASYTHLHFTHSNHTHFQGTLEIPKRWTFQGPASKNINRMVTIDQFSTSLAFALQMTPTVIARRVADTWVYIYPRSQSFKALASTVEEILPLLIQKLGPPPFSSLTIVETTEVQRSGLSGVIAMNRPAQAFFDKMQVDWINWHHWNLTSQLIRQWYGGAITSVSPDDDWLIEGLVEYLTIHVLEQKSSIWDLFRPILGDKKPLSLTYLQAANIFAGMLRQGAPFAILTKDTYESSSPRQNQDPLLFIKHAFALRQIADLSGESAFLGMLRSLNKEKRFQSLSPQEFMARFDHKPTPFSPSLREEVKESLKQWWTQAGWPDFRVTSFQESPLSEEKWVAKVTARQVGEIDFAPTFLVQDDNKKTYFVRGSQKTDTPDIWEAEVITEGRPLSTIVDPLRVTFDANRFDNSSKAPELVFFPGTTNTLRDDAYTVLWAPYPFRRPGEPLSFGVGASIRHYLESGLAVRVEYAPSTHTGSYLITEEINWPSQALVANFIASHSYFNDRRLEAALTRRPLFSAGPRLSVSLKVRRKEEAGQSQTRHITFGAAFAAKPTGVVRPCQPSFQLEWEKAPALWTKDFAYERKTGVGVGTCTFARGSGLRLRGFAGALEVTGVPPRTSQFRPNDLFEAGLRLDRNVPRVNRIMASQFDLFLPLFIPIPRNFVILPRQMKWRLFYDFGKSEDTNTTYRSGGAGFFLPLGGDLAGAGSLTLSRVSLLAILHQNVNGDITRRPGVVFDLTGDL